VIADEWADQFARALPLLVLPIVMPMNMDLIFFEFAIFFISMVYTFTGVMSSLGWMPITPSLTPHSSTTVIMHSLS